MHKNTQSLKTGLLLATGALLIFVFSRISSDYERYVSTQLTGLTMGTFYRVEIVGHDLDPAEYKQVKTRIDGVLGDVNGIMSIYKPDSDISRFNTSESVEAIELSEALVHVTKTALRVAKDSNGAFDPTVAPLVNLWGFGNEKVPDGLPEKPQIQQVLARVGYTNISVMADNKLQKFIPTISLDLGAVAKGAGADMTLFLLNDMGYSNALVEIGGEIAVSGHNKNGKPWKISVETPKFGAGIGESRYAILELSKGAVATSGDYRNYREEVGRNYTHVIDPRTGFPVSNNVASVTVVANDCMTADALATTLMVLGADEGMNFMKGQNGADAMIIVRNGSGEYRDYRTAGFDRYVFEN